MVKQIQRFTGNVWQENDRLDDLERRLRDSSNLEKHILNKPSIAEAPKWLPIDHDSRIAGTEYIYLLDNGNQVIGKEQLPGRIYYATGIWEPIHRFTHFMERPENPRKESEDEV